MPQKLNGIHFAIINLVRALFLKKAKGLKLRQQLFKSVLFCAVTCFTTLGRSTVVLALYFLSLVN